MQWWNNSSTYILCTYTHYWYTCTPINYVKLNYSRRSRSNKYYFIHMKTFSFQLERHAHRTLSAKMSLVRRAKVQMEVKLVHACPLTLKKINYVKVRYCTHIFQPDQEVIKLYPCLIQMNMNLILIHSELLWPIPWNQTSDLHQGLLW